MEGVGGKWEDGRRRKFLINKYFLKKDQKIGIQIIQGALKILAMTIAKNAIIFGY